MRSRSVVALTLAVAAFAAPALAGFAGTDVFLPTVGRKAGVFPSDWYTTVWIHNAGTATATAKIFLLKRGTANPSPPQVKLLVAPGDTEKIENAVESLFHTQVFGALRVVCDTQALVVTSRVYSKGSAAGERDSVGQDFAAVPASFAIGLGERSQMLGVYQTQPAAGSDYRFNFGLVETTGHPATVRVTAFDQTGAVQGATDVTVQELSQEQWAFKDRFPAVSTANTRLEIEVTSGAGKVIAFGSAVANGSQDPTTFEMTYAVDDTGITAVRHDATLTGDGTITAPLGLANGAVGKAKLAATGGASGQVLGTDGTNLSWQNPSGGGISGVHAGTGLVGGGTSGDVTLGIAVPLALAGAPAHNEAVLKLSSTNSEPALLSEGSGGTPRAAQFNGAVGIWAENTAALEAYGHGGWARLGTVTAAVQGNAIAAQEGVRGDCDSGKGVYGKTSTGYGVYGEAGGGNYGFLASPTYSVFGANRDGTIYGYLNNGANGATGRNGDNWGRIGGPIHAGYFNGTVYVSGAITKAGGGFQIDHPLDPENKVLNHSFVESPDMMNLYNGNVTTDEDGLAVVELPAWFEALNRDFRYQLTVIGRFAQAIVEEEITGNRFTIRTNLANVKVSWQVTGIRRDAWAEVHRIPVEADKPESERGSYLHPESFGQPPERSVEWLRSPDMMRPLPPPHEALARTPR